MAHESNSCHDWVRPVVPLKRVAATTQHANPIVWLQFFEGKTGEILDAQEIQPEAKIVEYLIYTAQPWLAPDDPPNQWANPVIAGYPTVSLRRPPVVKADSTHGNNWSDGAEFKPSPNSFRLLRA